MTKLSIEQLLYLLYAFSYSDENEENTVTKGTIKELLSKHNLKKDIDTIYEFLLKNDLIENPKRGRICITHKGIDILVDNLQSTNYRFDVSTAKGRLLNTLLHCLNLSSTRHQIASSNEIDFESFADKFKEFYFQEKKQQESSGVVAIHKREIYQKFRRDDSLHISQEQLDEYFDRLRATGKVFTSVGEDDELVHWAE